MSDPNCAHLHFNRIVNMDLGSFKSDSTKGVFRCKECNEIFIIESIRPYEINVIKGVSHE